MKRSFILLIAIILCFSLVMSLFSCSNGTSSDTNDVSGNGTQNNNDQGGQGGGDQGGNNDPTKPSIKYSEGLEFITDGYSAIWIGFGSCTDKEIIVPEEYEGLPVERVEYSYSFETPNDSITKIVLPRTIKNIGCGVFNALSALQYNEHEGLLYLGEIDNPYAVFMKATDYAMTSCKLHTDTRVISSESFYMCHDLTEITLSDKLEYIGFRAFGGCESLTKITLGASIPHLFNISNDLFGYYTTERSPFNVYEGGYYIGTNSNPYALLVRPSEYFTGVLHNDTIAIADYAFYNCGISEINFNEGLKHIGDYAFANNYWLKTVEIPTSVTSFGEYAFSSCRELWTIYLPDNMTTIPEGFCAESKITEISIPASVKRIEDAAFRNTNLATMDLPEGLEYLGGAFAGTAIYNINIPKNIKVLTDGAFQSCNNLREVVIPSQIVSMGDQVFAYCQSLTTVTVPDSVTEFGDKVFYHCPALTTVVLGEGIIEIGEYMFEECRNLTTVKVSSKLQAVDYTAFDGCNKMSYNTYEGGYYLGNDSNPYVALIKTRESGSITINENTYLIADRAFYYPGYIQSLTVPNSVRYIGDEAFYHFGYLEYITLSENLISIGDYSFYYTALREINIPASLTHIGYGSFGECEYINAFSVDSQNKFFKSVDGNLYSKDGTTFIRYASAKTAEEFTVPSDVVTIGDFAFSVSMCLKRINVPNGVEKIGDYAFSSRSTIEAISLPDSITYIGSYAFLGGQIQDINLSNKLTYIGDYAFESCILMKNIVIPDSVTYLGAGVFKECQSLKSVTIGSGVTKIYDDTFYRNHDLTTIVLPKSVTKIYENFYECDGINQIYYSGTEAEYRAIEIYSTYFPNYAKVHYEQ